MQNQKSLKFIFLFFFAALIAALQALSIYNYQGEKVDESEIVHYAVGFLGGSLDPVWIGYGTFSMYLLGGVYFLLGLPLITFGKYDSFLAYAAGLYEDHGFFIITARLIFALIGLGAALIYYKLGKRLGVSISLLACFLVLQILSPDALEFANYVRCDQLVAFFSACIAFTFVSNYSDYKKSILLAVFIAAATASKISAITLLAVLLVFLVHKYLIKSLSLKQVLVSLVVFQLAAFIFQPYGNIYQRFWSILEVMIFNSRVDAAKAAHLGFLAHTKEIVSIFNARIPWFISLCLIFYPFSFIKRKEISFYLLLILFLLIAPYYFSTEVTYYWFLPAFSLSRLLAILSLSDFIRFVLKKRSYLLDAVCTCAIFYISLIPLISGYKSFAYSNLQLESNALLTKRWLLESAYGKTHILLDTHYGHVMPKIYDPANLQEARKISRAFIFERSKIDFLNRAFVRFLEERKKGHSKSNFPLVRSVIAFNPSQTPEDYKERKGSYFVVSPSTYNRFLKNDGTGFSKEKMDFLELMQNYYKKMLDNELVASFSSGTGAPIEIYQVN